MLVDVHGWAWWYKAQQIVKHLSNEFDFIVMLEVEMQHRPQADEFELFMAFGITQLAYFRHIPKRKKIIGVTAVRPNRQIKDPCLEVYAVHTNSVMLYNQVKAFHPKVYCCPNGVDIEMFRSLRPRRGGPLRFSYVGKHVPEKHLDTIIRPACRTVGARLSAHTKDYRNADPLEAMVEFYQDIDVHITASTIDGTPNPCLEAAACGKPIISNKIGNMPEFIINGVNGFLVDMRVEAYVEKIRYFLSQPWQAELMGKNALAMIHKKWTWEIQVEAYRKMFRELV